jgi:hypothetical protein
MLSFWDLKKGDVVLTVDVESPRYEIASWSYPRCVVRRMSDSVYVSMATDTFLEMVQEQ